MSAQKCPTPCKGSGEAITNRKEKRMPTQSLTSDDLAARVTEALTEFSPAFYDLVWYGRLNKYEVKIYVDARFTGEFVDHTLSGNYVIRAEGDSLLSVLGSAYARLAVSLPLVVSA